LPALAYFSKIFTLHVFLSNLPSNKGRSNVTYPVRVRVNSCSNVNWELQLAFFKDLENLEHFQGALGKAAWSSLAAYSSC
jgi:hypothetical protein